MTGIWFSSNANITDRNLAKFITLLPTSNMTPLGGKAAFICHAIQFVTAGLMLIKIRAVLLSVPHGKEGPPFIGASTEEPLRENFEGAFQCNFIICCNTLSMRTIMNKIKESPI